VLIHSNFNYKLIINSGGLGDFYFHGFGVTIDSQTVSDVKKKIHISSLYV